MKNQSRIVEFLFAFGVLSSFLGSYFSVSLIGLGTGLVLIFGTWSVVITHQGAQMKKNPLFIPLALLILAILLSIIFARPYAYWKPLGKLRYLGCYFLFAVYFIQHPQMREKVAKVGVAISLLLGVTAILQHFGIFSPLELISHLKPSPIPGISNRFLATGFAFHHNPFGATMNFLCPIMLASAYFTPEKKLKRWYILATIFCTLAIACSFSRSSWLAWAISTGLFLFYLHPKIALSFLGALFGTVVSLFTWYEPFRARASQFSLAANSERLELWRICWEMFKDSPWVGHGFYSFGTHFKKYTQLHESVPNFPVEAHNMYLDLLSGTGVIGLTAFCYFALTVLIVLGKGLRSSECSNSARIWILGGLVGFVAFLVGGIFDKLFYMTQTIVTVWFFLAISISVVMDQKQKPNQE